MATWRKSPPALIDAFAAALPEDARVVRRQMFGYPCAFVNGNMACGLHQENLVLRLAEADAAKLGGAAFEPMKGRPMRGYFTAPVEVVSDRKALAAWIARAVEHTAGLPAKAAKTTSGKSVKSAKAASTKKPRVAGKRAGAA